MKRIRQYALRLIVTLISLAGGGAAVAQSYNLGSKMTFISELCIDREYHCDPSSAMKDKGWTFIDVDLNDDCGIKTDYIYLGYKTTTNPAEAITDIIIARGGQYSGDKNVTITYEGRTYRAAYYDDDSDGGDLNDTAGGSYIYVYYTKDKAVNELGGLVPGTQAVTRLDVFVDQKGKRNANSAQMYDGGKLVGWADLNDGVSAHWIDLQVTKHTHSQFFDYSGQLGMYGCDCGHFLEDFDQADLDKNGNYIIKNCGNLLWFSNHVREAGHENASARLVSDIDMTPLKDLRDGNTWMPIGTFADKRWWCGTFDGMNHTISNLKFSNVGDSQCAGLFGRASGCVIRNLNVTHADVQGSSAAILVGAAGNDFSMSNCSVSGKVSGLLCAGLALRAGTGRRSLVQCTNEASVTGVGLACGILGNSDSEIAGRDSLDRCVNKGSVDCAFGKALAITSMQTGYIKNCLNLICPSVMFTSGAFAEVTEPANTTLVGNLNMGSCTLVKNTTGFREAHHNYYTVREADRNTRLTAEQLTYAKSSDLQSGNICYLLNMESTDPSTAWRQKLGTDNHPTPTAGENAVFPFTKCNGKQHYSNYWMYAEDASDGLHHYDNDFYDVVNAWDPSTSTANLIVTFTCRYCGDKIYRQPTVSTQNPDQVLCTAGASIIYSFKVLDKHSHEYMVLRRAGDAVNLNRKHSNPVKKGDLYVCNDCGGILGGVQPKQDENGNYLIANYGNLLWFSQQANGGQQDICARQIADIDLLQYKELGMTGWTSIGTKDKEWTGSYDGDGHRIILNSPKEGDGNITLFGYVQGGKISNLIVEGYSHGANTGLLCRYADRSEFINCTSIGEITGASVAGMCYRSTNCNFTLCRNYARVTGMQSVAGGLVGITYSGEFSRCANFGDVLGKANYIGGLVGQSHKMFVLKDCGNYGNVSGTNCVGGIIGSAGLLEEVEDLPMANATQPTIYRCLNAGKVRLTNESNSKGAFLGHVNMPEEELTLLVNNNFYLNSQLPIGNIKTETGQGIITKVKEEELASGDVCISLNDGLSGDNLVWKQDETEGANYPVPFWDGEEKKDVMYRVLANGGSFLVKPDQTIDELTLEDPQDDEYQFYSPVSFRVKDLTYHRMGYTLKQDFCWTIYLPFSFECQEYEVYKYIGVDEQTHILCFEPVNGPTQPNTPYLIRLAKGTPEGELKIHVQDACIVPTITMVPFEASEQIHMPNGFYGTYETRSGLYGDEGFFAYSTYNGDFRRCSSEDDGSLLKPFRGIIKLDKTFGKDLQELDINEPVGNPSGIHISQMEILPADLPTYDLQGRRVQRMQEGQIYVRGGKKFIYHAL